MNLTAEKKLGSATFYHVRRDQELSHFSEKLGLAFLVVCFVFWLCWGPYPTSRVLSRPLFPRVRAGLTSIPTPSPTMVGMTEAQVQTLIAATLVAQERTWTASVLYVPRMELVGAHY